MYERISSFPTKRKTPKKKEGLLKMWWIILGYMMEGGSSLGSYGSPTPSGRYIIVKNIVDVNN